MNISVVIPVYNEAAQLADCLRALARQTVQPFEVIVVDNNSTDSSAQVARGFSFVRVVSEPKQGVIHARKRGFDLARGDIIARIDGDSLLPTDWIANLQQIFQDSSIDAVSGAAQYYNVAASTLFNASDLFFRRRLSRQLGDRVFLWGANMAITRRAWRRVRPLLCNRGGMHEDFDIGIHLQEIGGKVIFDENLLARVSARRVDVDFRSFVNYVMISPRTYAQHHIRARRHMYPVVALCIGVYLPARLLHRGYNPQTERFSWSRALADGPIVQRVDPTANVA